MASSIKTRANFSSELDDLYKQLTELEAKDCRIKRKMGYIHLKQMILARNCRQQVQPERSGTPKKSTSRKEQATELGDLQAAHEKWTSRKVEVDRKRSLVRLHINTLSRLFLRPLNILDLPDEILMQTFGYLKESEYRAPHGIEPRRAGYFADMKSIRLTCQRFCNTSSHLLIPTIRVNMRP